MPRKNSPYTSHPLYVLRRAALFTSAASLILTISITSTLFLNRCGPWLIGMLLFFSSILLVQADFASWRDSQRTACQVCHQQKGRLCQRDTVLTESSSPPERTPLLRSNTRGATVASRGSNSNEDDGEVYNWPQRLIMIGDFTLAAAFLFLYWIEVVDFVSDPYGYHRSSYLFPAYASLGTLVAGLVHAKSWWLEFMARKKQKWAEEERDAMTDEEQVDVEAACADCRCDTQKSQSQDKNEESKILNRVLTFLQRNEVDTTGSADSSTAREGSTEDENVNRLTPSSSASGDTVNGSLTDRRELCLTSDGKQIWIENATMEDDLVKKKGKPKKNKKRNQGDGL